MGWAFHRNYTNQIRVDVHKKFDAKGFPQRLSKRHRFHYSISIAFNSEPLCHRAFTHTQRNVSAYSSNGAINFYVGNI